MRRRLPWQWRSSTAWPFIPATSYPANAATVQHLLEHDVDVIAIRHTNEATLLELVARLNLQERLLLLVENPHYVAYQVLRDDELHYERWRVDFGDVIRAQDHVIRRSSRDSRQFDLTLTVQSLAEMATNYNFRARLVDAAGTIWSEDQGWPWNAPTSAWPLLERRYDHRKLVLPPDAPPGLYAIELSLVDPATHDVATVTDVATGAPLGTAWRLDYFPIGTPENAAPLADGREYLFGDALALVGADLPTELLPGEPVAVRLGWLAQKPVDQDYTVFVHLIDGDGNVVAQHDKPPLDGFYPTSHWIPDQPIIDNYMLQLPEVLPPGPYRLHVGFYRPDSGQRLAVSGGDNSTHDEAVLQIPDGTAQWP